MFARQLEYLIELSRTRHFARAAKACRVSQPALSGGIRSLEKELGISIVRRHRSFLGFTADGERLLVWARRILADWEGFRQEASISRSHLTGTLRVGVIPTAEAILPLVTEPMRLDSPDATHQIISLTSDELIRQLQAFDLDLGISYLEDPLPPGIRGLPLYLERYLLLVPRQLRLAATASLSWFEAAALPLCLLTQDMQNRRIIDAAFRRAGVTAQVVVETDSVLSLLAYVDSGLCSVVPQSLWHPRPHQGEVLAIPLEPRVDQAVGLLLIDREPVPPLVARACEVAAQLQIGKLLAMGDRPGLSRHRGQRLDRRPRAP